MKNQILELPSGTLMLVVKNENGTFSPLGLTKEQSVFLNACIASISENSPLVKNDIELSVKTDSCDQD